MSIPDKVVPFKRAPATRRTLGAPQITTAPGLHPQAIQGLDALYPGTLTAEMRALLEKTCGLSVSGFASIDFTASWYPEEPIGVFRPSVTLAIDDEGRRWIGETSRQQGLPGPIWCVFTEPAVALYVSDDLSGFLDELNQSTRHGQLAKWLRELHGAAHRIWSCRHSFAQESYELCRKDQGLRGWLAELPIDARVYDLRASSTPRGWPYGLAGPEGRFYRCGRLPVFAVAAAPSTPRWRQHMAHIAATGQLARPAVVASLAA